MKTFTRGHTTMDMSLMESLPKILGNADPIHYAQMLPGIQTNNEYDSGIHIYGCDNTHNMVTIDGVPIYNASHLLGLFSVFNASHFPAMLIDKTAAEAAFPNILGGQVDMQTSQPITDSLSCEGAVGLISSQGTLRMPVGGKSQLVLSLRASYMNLLYGYALKTEDSNIGYSFWDSNVTWIWKPQERHTITLNGYWGGDKATMDDESYLADIHLRWGNAMASACWDVVFQPDASLHQTLFYTSYRNQFRLTQQSIDFAMPSAISTLGYKGYYQNSWLKTGAEVLLHSIEPQAPQLHGSYNITNTQEAETKQAQEYSIYADCPLALSNTVTIQAGCRLTAFNDDERQFHYSASPSLAVVYDRKTWDCSATCSFRHQYLFRTGFSSMGLPTEFWMSSHSDCPSQRTHSYALTFGKTLADGTFRLSVEAYFKKLSNLIEYNGTVYDFINTKYQLNNQLLHGNGRNYGLNLLIAKQRGRLTGWISYNIGRALRKFDEIGTTERFPASHERIHELNAVIAYAPGKRWDFGLTGIFASGTPFTTAEQFYLFSGNIMTQFGNYNANRLNSYYRIDLSANYLFKSRRNRQSGINLSIYNAMARENELYYSWKIMRNGEFKYRPVSFIIRIMPSVSYFFKF